ncbi:hypothetical protein [Bradyrhizobium sp. 170]|uniref:hypothetical protein n=1 Tax=Bradyrhizobium sp. 170 TaxID=2782641 RepID=UPI001FFE5968|nr:hypothetical protein [Bradyrhizobium sp. 170]UPK04546.1 hypothetical protein IVB05_02000 [Bradyrhizobium sp. 170]
MATPPRKPGGGKAGGPPPAAHRPQAAGRPPAAEPPPAADRPVKLQPVDASRPEIATYTAQTSSTYTIPPQGPGAPTRLRYDGGPASEERLNTAMKALLDPVARTSSSRVYSGQARNWRR